MNKLTQDPLALIAFTQANNEITSWNIARKVQQIIKRTRYVIVNLMSLFR